MFYSTELNFLKKVFTKCHLNIQTINPYAPFKNAIQNFDLRHFINEDEYDKTIYDYINPFDDNTIYKIRDIFSCCYMFMKLPDNSNETVLSIGPYLSSELTHEQILEKIEKLGIDIQRRNEIERCYSSIPVIEEGDCIFVLLDAFAENLWGESNYKVFDLNREHSGAASPLQIKKEQNDSEKTILNMQIMESRYSYENEIMKAVSTGQTHKAELMLSRFSNIAFESRLSDPLRNMKNYCIIMNTLLRKAAENGGVHPIYLDSTSSDFARKIELLNSVYAIQGFMLEMFRSYCRLVNKHSMKNYSAPVQKAIVYIDSDLTADLSLSAIANNLNISPGYLSAIFKKETGQTLTDHVNRKRIKNAMLLLETTKLQIQTIAQYCGIIDMQYFTKMFKKYTGTTPKKYRESK